MSIVIRITHAGLGPSVIINKNETTIGSYVATKSETCISFKISLPGEQHYHVGEDLRTVVHTPIHIHQDITGANTRLLLTPINQKESLKSRKVTKKS